MALFEVDGLLPDGVHDLLETVHHLLVNIGMGRIGLGQQGIGGIGVILFVALPGPEDG